MSKHTPGPWGARITDSGAWAIFNSTGIWIATTLRKQWKEEDAANARLMIAAPDLLDACQAADWHSLDLPEFVREKLSAAIAKATGA